MLGEFQTGNIIKSQTCSEFYQGLGQQWRSRIEIKRYDQHWFNHGSFKRFGFHNTETIIIEKRPKYIY